jgi:hypothetical protein
MKQHKKAQQIAKNYFEELIQDNYPKGIAWDEAMALFKLEMQK